MSKELTQRYDPCHFQTYRAPEVIALIPATGGADWNRTSDPLLAKQVLSQLSYSPILGGKSLSLMSCAWCSENQDSDGGPG